MSSQEVAVASQKFTWPCVTGVLAASTLAVSVTKVPAGTVVTALPSAFTASLVVVAAGPGTGAAGIAAISTAPNSASNPTLILSMQAAIAIVFHVLNIDFPLKSQLWPSRQFLDPVKTCCISTLR